MPLKQHGAYNMYQLDHIKGLAAELYDKTCRMYYDWQLIDDDLVNQKKAADPVEVFKRDRDNINELIGYIQGYLYPKNVGIQKVSDKIDLENIISEARTHQAAYLAIVVQPTDFRPELRLLPVDNTKRLEDLLATLDDNLNFGVDDVFEDKVIQYAGYFADAADAIMGLTMDGIKL